MTCPAPRPWSEPMSNLHGVFAQPFLYLTSARGQRAVGHLGSARKWPSTAPCTLCPRNLCPMRARRQASRARARAPARLGELLDGDDDLLQQLRRLPIDRRQVALHVLDHVPDQPVVLRRHGLRRAAPDVARGGGGLELKSAQPSRVGRGGARGPKPRGSISFRIGRFSRPGFGGQCLRVPSAFRFGSR